METNAILWIGGIAVVAVGAYLIYKKIEDNPRKVFLENVPRFKAHLEQLRNDNISIEKWTEVVVSINNKSLTKWWRNIVSDNSDVASLKTSLINCLKNWGVVEIIAPPRPINQRLAKNAFIANIGVFAPILGTLNNQTFNPHEWTEAIVSVNDKNLTALWEKYVKAGKVQEKWKQLLASWQIKSDTCTSFTCNTADNISAYQLPNGDGITLGVKYKVESPCWVLTAEDAVGKITKTVINKGIVTPIL